VIKTIEIHTCPECNSINIIKNGKDYKGSQKYHGHDCDSYGTLGAKPRYSEEFKEMVIRAYFERVSMEGIRRIFGVNPKLLKDRGKKLPELEETLDEARLYYVLELDELWSYVLKKVKSQILFTTLTADSQIDELTTEILEIFRRGVVLEAVNRTQERWHEIRCKVVDDAAAYTVSYTPFSAKNERVERWITKWRSYFQEVSTKKQLPSDNGCRVSYNLSLRERLAI